jgi:hypothetical protein
MATVAVGNARAGAPPPWDPDPSQGTHLQGIQGIEGIKAPEPFYIQSTATSPISAPGGVLILPFGQTDFVASAGPNQEKVNVKIVQTYFHANPSVPFATAASYEYEIKYGKEKADQPLCGKNNRALAIPGQYSKTPFQPPGPLYSATVNIVSFSCVPQKIGTWKEHAVLRGGGVAAKCVDWGYPPWFLQNAFGGSPLPWVGTTAGGSPLPRPATGSASTAQEIHDACLFMAIADYCGKGEPHTLDGTVIADFDAKTITPHVQSATPPVDPTFKSSSLRSVDFFFEAAWRSGTLGEQQSLPGGAYCLSKKRWATIPYIVDSAKCPNLNPESCHELEKDMEDKPRVLLFSYSLFKDVALYTCPNTSDPPLWRTTTTEQLDETSPFIPLNDQNNPTYTHTETNPHSTFSCGQNENEGTVLRSGIEGTPLPQGFPVDWKGKKQPVALYFQGDNLGPDKYKTDTNNNGKPPIGYILPATVCPNGQGHFCGMPLKLFKACPPVGKCRGNNERYLTTTKNPTGPFAGLSGQVLGYLIDLTKP